MFRQLFAAIGIGNASVDTQLFNNQIMPGQELKGQVVVRGGSIDQDIEHLTISVMTRVEVESGNGEYATDQPTQRILISNRFTIRARQELVFPFAFQLHPETPVSDFDTFGISINRTAVWIHTDLGIAWATDAIDKDWLYVLPTPAMQYIHNAMIQLGYGLYLADVERGQLRGSGFQSSLGCYQELEYRPSGWSNTLGFREIEISFVTMPYETGVLIEADRSWRNDLYRSFIMRNRELHQKDWAAEIQHILY